LCSARAQKKSLIQVKIDSLTKKEASYNRYSAKLSIFFISQLTLFYFILESTEKFAYTGHFDYQEFKDLRVLAFLYNFGLYKMLKFILMDHLISKLGLKWRKI